MDTKIFIVTHDIFNMPSDDTYIPLHAGKIGAKELGYIGDDTGDNVSEKHDKYSEQSAEYWIWKNVKSPIVGFCYYRRLFVNEDKKLLNQKDIELYLKEFDMITTEHYVSYPKTIKEQFDKDESNDGARDYLKLAREALLKCYPDYLNSFDFVMNSYNMFYGNMCITYKKLFDEYCQWLFGFLEQYENTLNIKYDGYFQSRVLSFVSERMFTVWICNHKLRIKECKTILGKKGVGFTKDELEQLK